MQDAPLITVNEQNASVICSPAVDLHQPPPPPPPRPPRPQKVPGYILSAHSSPAAASCLQQQVFFARDKDISRSIRGNQPIFLLDLQSRQLHGAFRRNPDEQLLQQDLTSAPQPQGYQIHVTPLFCFPAPLSFDAVQDLLVTSHQQPAPTDAGTGSVPGSCDSFEAVLGSQQHGALWEAFMKQAKRRAKALEAVQEEPEDKPDPAALCKGSS